MFLFSFFSMKEASLAPLFGWDPDLVKKKNPVGIGSICIFINLGDNFPGLVANKLQI